MGRLPPRDGTFEGRSTGVAEDDQLIAGRYRLAEQVG
ncbi:MAG: hypothetical protein QOE59_3710, partial [Actinomycetota bacterium]|nr:hypothetical protein [Actinomycetota bacterium]